MNTDVGDLLKRIRIRNPVAVGAVVSVLIALVLAAISATIWIRARTERQELEVEMETVQLSVAQVYAVQRVGPERLRNEIDQARERILAITAGFPMTQQVAQELSTYYSLATRYNTELTRMEALLPAGEEPETVYDQQQYTLEARGEYRDLLRFLRDLTDVRYGTFIFDGLSVSEGPPAWAEIELTVFSLRQPLDQVLP